MISALVGKALRVPFVLNVLRRAWKRYGISIHEDLQPSLTDVVNSDIPEIGPIGLVSSELNSPRINILIPAVSLRHTFGGVSTALSIFFAMSKNFADARVIVTDEIDLDGSYGCSELNDYVLSHMEDDRSGRLLVFAGNRYGKKLPVRSGDLFVATAWWTAYNGFEILKWQDYVYGARKDRCLCYVIQDFEPGFYPWSSRYMLALSTYQEGSRIVAVVNSDYLSDYIKNEGFVFRSTHVFKPRISASLLRERKGLSGSGKERLILVYGRPGVTRNAFELIVQGLKVWAAMDSRAGWRVVSLGEEHGSVDLGGGVRLESYGKISLSEYSEFLKRASLGVSLMVSPHPSYPPLEMAAYGVGVVTNVFEDRDLSQAHPGVDAVRVCTPREFAQALQRQQAKFEADNSVFVRSADEFSWNYLSSDGVDVGFGARVITELSA